MGTDTADSPSLVAVRLMVRVMNPTGSVLTVTALAIVATTKPARRVATCFLMGTGGLEYRD